MATKKTDTTRAARARKNAGSESSSPIEAKRAALEAAERRAGGVRASGARARTRNAAPQSATRGSAAQGAKAGARTKPAKRAAAAPAKKSARGKDPGKKAATRAPATRKGGTKRVSEKLWRLAEQKSAARSEAPAWQQIAHHDGHAQFNAPPVRSARIAAGKRGDRRLTPAEKQRAGE